VEITVLHDLASMEIITMLVQRQIHHLKTLPHLLVRFVAQKLVLQTSTITIVLLAILILLIRPPHVKIAQIYLDQVAMNVQPILIVVLVVMELTTLTTLLANLALLVFLLLEPIILLVMAMERRILSPCTLNVPDVLVL